MIEEKKAPFDKPKNQNIHIENREKLHITGVLDVDSFNEEIIIAHTELGLIVVRGVELRINKLTLDSNELNVEGKIYALEYNDLESDKKGKLLKKMFK